jgi:mono/diheme cytochrome c family protein
LHVTFLDCAVCHESINNDPVEVRWVGNATGRPQEPPAVLRLIRFLEDMGDAEPQATRAQPTIIALLKEMASTAGPDAEVADLLIQLETTVPHSPFWRKSVQELRRVLPLHARGEYGAKMARDHRFTDPGVTSRLTREYLAPDATTEQRTEISKRIHANVVARPGACSACHAVDGGKFNFLAAGYSPERSKTLRALPLARMVEQIRSGESFQLPRLMEGRDGR